MWLQANRGPIGCVDGSHDFCHGFRENHEGLLLCLEFVFEFLLIDDLHIITFVPFFTFVNLYLRRNASASHLSFRSLRITDQSFVTALSSASSHRSANRAKSSAVRGSS